MDISELKRLDPAMPINRHPWEKSRARIISFFLSRHQKHSHHIADIGSGDSFVLNRLAEKGVADSYSAIDTAYSNEIIELIGQIEKNSPVQYLYHTNELANFGKKADCFLLLDVLEHCEDDQAVLQSVSESTIASDNALFIITVPAFQSLFSGHDKLLQHFRRYNRKQLKTLVENCSLEVIQSGYFFNSLVPVRIFQLFLEKLKLRKPVSSLDSWKANKVITNIFYTILWADFRAGHFFTKIGIRFPGLSCYCICRKLPS